MRNILLWLTAFLAAFSLQAQQPFSASLRLELKDSKQSVAGAVVYEGDLVMGYIDFDPAKWDGKTNFYCYVFTYSENEEGLGLAYPFYAENAVDNRFPKRDANGKIQERVTLFEGIISPPFGKDNFVLLMTDNPIVNPQNYLNETRSGFSGRQELLKLIKGSKLSGLYRPEYGKLEIRTMQLESRPAEEKKGLVKNSSKASSVFAFNDSAEVFYTPFPQTDIVRDSFPMIEIIDPSFDTSITKGLKILPPADNKKLMIRGIAVDWKRGVNKITINGEPPSSFRESSGYFDYLYDLKEGVNTAVIRVENNKGFAKSMRLRFEHHAKKEALSAEGKDHLLVIGVNEYKEWPKLYNASRDAKDFKKLMTDQYGFKKGEVVELFDDDASRKKIYAQLRKMVEELQPNDRLLVYFSGHGYYDKSLDMGYWIPADAHNNSEDEYISNLDITRMVQKMKAKNIFVIADACYSGQLLRDMHNEGSKDYRSRMVLCSGKLQPVSDGKSGTNSPFAAQVLKFFQTPGAKNLLASDLIQYVKRSFDTKDQKPVGGAIDEVGDENGDFIFTRSN